MKHPKYVHGRVRLATGTPRVGEYDYVERTYEPADYYGDHFMYRDDRNLLPIRQGLYGASSPYTFKSTTAFPPQTLYSPHSSSYLGGSNPMTPPYLSGAYRPLGSDHDLWSELEEEQEVELMDEALQEDQEEGSNFFSQAWTDVTNWWDSLSGEEKVEAVKTGYEVADTVINETGTSGTSTPNGAKLPTGEQINALPSDVLRGIYKLIQNKLPPFASFMMSESMRKDFERLVRNELAQRGLLAPVLYPQSVVIQTDLFDMKTPKAFSPLTPSVTGKKPKGTQDEEKSNVGALVIGASVLAIAAKLLL